MSTQKTLKHGHTVMSMNYGKDKNKLITVVRRLKRSKIKQLVDARMHQFDRLGKSSGDKIFSELCFCILTANYTAKGGIRIQNEIGNGFLTMTKKQLAHKLKELGHRFPNTRANYMINDRKHKKEIINSLRKLKGYELRDWLVKNVKGLGYKEASHFLRNTGHFDYAIIDFHIIDLLDRYGLIKKSNVKTMTKKTYLSIEKILKSLSDKLGMALGELDLYLWYIETGKVLK